MSEQALLRLVRDADDSAEYQETLEGARDEVRRHLLPMLAAAYPALDWRQRRALVYLVQDHVDAATRPMMQDFLEHAPDAHADEQEAYQIARAIALCHLEGDVDAFSEYLADPAMVERKREAWRRRSRA